MKLSVKNFDSLVNLLSMESILDLEESKFNWVEEYRYFHTSNNINMLVKEPEQERHTRSR